MIAPVPPGFVKMASGKLVPASRSFGAPKAKTKRFLIVLQHYDGDVKEAEELASLIADLERTRNHEADVMLFRRGDSREMSSNIRAKLESKFDKVILQACRRADAKGYPMGANQMFSDLMTLMAQVPPFATDYYAFIPLESDAVPTRPGWIGELIAAWKTAHAQGKGAIGHIHDNPVNHLNGLAVYSSDMFRRVPGNKLLGCNPQICYDVYFANFILPHASDTPLIYFEYRKPIITPEELFAPRKEGVVPALWHGVKDGSARAAVRARHISFTAPAPVVEPPPSPDPSTLGVAASIGFPTKPPSSAYLERNNPFLESTIRTAIKLSSEIMVNDIRPLLPNPELSKRPNVYCYHQPASKANADEQQAVQAIWRKAWATRGFNPVVLTLRDAARNPRYDDFQTKIERFPFIGGKKDAMNRFNRWLALEMSGGGLMVDVDVLPGAFTPADIEGDANVVLSSKDGGLISAAVFNAKTLVEFIHEIELYDAKPEDLIDGRECVTDLTVYAFTNRDNPFENEEFRDLVVDVTSGDTKSAKLVRFSEVSGRRRSEAMELFLAGNETVVA